MENSKVWTGEQGDTPRNRVAIGTYLRVLRLQRGLKLIDLKRQLGIPTSSMSNIEVGNTLPELDRLQKLSDFFGVSIDDVMKMCFKKSQYPTIKLMVESQEQRNILDTNSIDINEHKELSDTNKWADGIQKLRVERTKESNLVNDDEALLSELSKHMVSLNNHFATIKEELQAIRIIVQNNN